MTSYHNDSRFTRQAEQDARDAETRFENCLNYTMREPDELAKALADYLDFKRLAAICKLATSDEAMAGRQLCRLAIECAHEHSRYEADADETIPPLEGWKDTRPVSLLPMVAGMFQERLGAAAVSANAEPPHLASDGSGEPNELSKFSEEVARLREGGAI